MLWSELQARVPSLHGQKSEMIVFPPDPSLSSPRGCPGVPAPEVSWNTEPSAALLWAQLLAALLSAVHFFPNSPSDLRSCV